MFTDNFILEWEAKLNDITIPPLSTTIVPLSTAAHTSDLLLELSTSLM